MKEELVEKVQVVMVEIIDTMMKAKDFALDQAPEVISQLLMWKTVSSLMWFGFGIVLSMLCAYSLKMWHKTIKWGDSYNNDDVGWVFTLLFLVFICGMIMLANLTWLKIWIAPKLYLMEYAANLVG